MEIQIAKIENADKILDIYKYYIENTPITFEYEVPSTDEFKKRISNTLKKYPYIIAKDNDSIVGYAYASSFKGRRAYDWSAEISIYVKNGYTKKSIGTMMYSELENHLKSQNIQNLYACITYPNEKSVNFHTKMGYKKVAYFTKCGYKFGEWRDVIWMEKFIGNHTNPLPFIDFSNI